VLFSLLGSSPLTCEADLRLSSFRGDCMRQRDPRFAREEGSDPCMTAVNTNTNEARITPKRVSVLSKKEA
jgi:hypothetical protein